MDVIDSSSLRGNVHETFYDIEKEVGMLDYSMWCRWYVSEVFPAMTKHTYISLHDVHNPKFWGDSFDDKAFRDASTLHSNLMSCPVLPLSAHPASLWLLCLP